MKVAVYSFAIKKSKGMVIKPVFEINSIFRFIHLSWYDIKISFVVKSDGNYTKVPFTELSLLEIQPQMNNNRTLSEKKI